MTHDEHGHVTAVTREVQERTELGDDSTRAELGEQCVPCADGFAQEIGVRESSAAHDVGVARRDPVGAGTSGPADGWRGTDFESGDPEDRVRFLRIRHKEQGAVPGAGGCLGNREEPLHVAEAASKLGGEQDHSQMRDIVDQGVGFNTNSSVATSGVSLPPRRKRRSWSPIPPLKVQRSDSVVGARPVESGDTKSRTAVPSFFRNARR